ncbi:aminodeoxychorismate synthase component I [Frankia sp. CNm7]|uniref:Aminodeoxychorismate synthase component I n=1 Tax=Frankia nepalensis TaxID=1836974 RepID=A0A937UV44_9ACTN|nr:aminodeoxychorismate synthase component I [Frankia nepalensis]MBL7502670.1 aminodeoxychorismate synthase component I [Frankia nepalensis]MBL7514934.1 aminodeoxychorismate synthase component I [Frankia nepalensis]MBL7524259.1 aminodeoxychorismate synthase component I [Frankia nepalensis]MBL7632895.1 aminodeoxychorismate synthase component I [Frankia nepalensis]
MAAYARFDDLRTGVAWEFGQAAYELAAGRPRDVAGLLAEVEAATADGWWAYGYVAYEAAAGLDPSLAVHPAQSGLPLAWFGVCAPPALVPTVRAPDPAAYQVGEWRVAWDEDTHRRRVAAVRRQIAAGETYQANLTTRMSAGADGDSRAFYAALALGQRGAFNAYLDLGRFAIASASPELFFETAAREVRMRPMKGTARRGRSPAEDAAIVAALRASEKERAENIMIVDLVRNDLARVAATGSVRVTSLCRAEQYETVHQLTSGVSARLRPDVGLVEVFRALFPCGSVTGAPKPRTMEIIRDLEDGPRGVYCGAIGMLAPPSAPFQARFNVPIRTAVVDRATGTAVYGTGGGITWDSAAADEYAELRAKAEVLTRLSRPSRPRIPR